MNHITRYSRSFKGPEFDEKHPIELITAPYVTNVIVRFSKLIFTNHENMVNYTVVVGVGKDCS